MESGTRDALSTKHRRKVPNSFKLGGGSTRSRGSGCFNARDAANPNLTKVVSAGRFATVLELAVTLPKCKGEPADKWPSETRGYERQKNCKQKHA